MFMMSVLLPSIAALALADQGLPVGSKIDFNRDVRPVLSENCFHCHGPDPTSRKAGLRLDTQKGAMADLGGYQAVVSGQPDKSEIWKRITTSDPDDQMPPPDSHKKLSKEQIDLIKTWISQGAEWQPHWAFMPPGRPAVPAIKSSKNLGWAKNPIDHFIAARLEEVGLAPVFPASKEALIRRVTLDLTGLPPTMAEIDAFTADMRPDAYGRLVDRLLGSVRYGEHQARIWLDAARYADTHGLHYDNKRSIWPYRDWVVRAFNSNMPFDRFTIEQLAGDLLDKPTREQLTATGFLRAHVTTNEGGVIPEEEKSHFVRDRTETFSTIWLGLTAGCAACHDHKYDPITQKDFYQLTAYFDNGTDKPLDGNVDSPAPFLRLSTPGQEKELAILDKEIAAVRQKIRTALDRTEYVEPVSEESLRHLAPSDYVLRAGSQEPLRVGAGDKFFAFVRIDPRHPPRALMLKVHASLEHWACWGKPLADDPHAQDCRLMGPLPRRGSRVRLEVAADAVSIAANSKVRSISVFQDGVEVPGEHTGIRTLTPQGGRLYDSLLVWETIMAKAGPQAPVPDPIKWIFPTPRAKRSELRKRELRDYFFEHVYQARASVFRPLHEELEPLEKKRTALDDSIPHTLVFAENPEREPSYVLLRGQYDRKGDSVTPKTPGVLPPMPDNAPANRLALARWLLDPEHPLTARVTVNRLWQQHFGTGIVKTVWDFGIQGEWPTHPELLDWLATQFVSSGWNIKAMHKLMVMSAAYKQSAVVTKEKLDKDLDNRLLARGPRFRLDGEVLRDSALAASGLLAGRLGGPGVKPYEPGDLWKDVAFLDSNTGQFKPDHGEDLYRRSLYTFWKRTSPQPAMAAFDAPTRETCTVRRERTNTPLQALVLMNDTQFVEAARMLGERIMREGGATPGDRITYAFRLATGRRPQASEARVLHDLWSARLEAYRKDRGAAEALLKVGDSAADGKLPAPDLAAWTVVASTLLNLDETITN